MLAREDRPGQPRLVAYFTGQDAVEVASPAQLRAQLQAHLPDAMVPVAFVRLAALPLTANGKLDPPTCSSAATRRPRASWNRPWPSSGKACCR